MNNETPPKTFPVSVADIRAPRRHAGEVCTRASKSMRTVHSGMSEAARRSAHGMQWGYLSGERQNLSLVDNAKDICVSCRYIVR